MTPAETLIPELLGSRLRARRRELRLSLRDVAGRAGITFGSLSRIETGENTPTLQTLVNLCDLLDVTAQQILNPTTASWTWLHRAAVRRDVGRAAFELLTDPADTTVGLIEGRLLPAAQTPMPSAEGNFGRVVCVAEKGTSLVTVGKDVHVLQEGDALTVPGVASLKWSATVSSEAKALWIFVPAVEFDWLQ